jgi:WD40 repeat protein
MRSLRILLSVLDRGPTVLVDQALRQIMEPVPCIYLDRTLYGATWPSVGGPIVLVQADEAVGEPERYQPARIIELVGGWGRQSGTFLSPEGRRIIITAGGDTAELRRARDGVVLAVLQRTGGELRRAEWSPDKRRLLTVGGTSSVRLWNAADGALLQALPAQPSVVAVAWSQDSKRFATAGADGVRVWSVGVARALMESAGVSNVVDLGWSADEARLLAVDAEGVIHSWEVASGREVMPPEVAHDGVVLAARWSPHGHYVVLIGDDNIPRVWDMARHEQVSALANINLPLATILWKDDERRFLVASANGMMCTHNTHSQLIETVRGSNIQKLSQAEEQEVLGQLLRDGAAPAFSPLPSAISVPTDTPQPSVTPEPSATAETLPLIVPVAPTATPALPADTPTRVLPTVTLATPSNTTTATLATPSNTPTATLATPSDTPTNSPDTAVLPTDEVGTPTFTPEPGTPLVETPAPSLEPVDPLPTPLDDRLPDGVDQQQPTAEG